jgi:hypothetical protein
LFKIVYQVTWPNGNIYIGSDLTDSIAYFGSTRSRVIEADSASRSSRRAITVARGILWESETANDAKVRKTDAGCVRAHRPKDPAPGYNRQPKFRANPLF